MEKELIKAYGDYIALLERAIGSSAAYLMVHGWNAPPEDIKLGEELRAKIKELTTELSTPQ